MVANRPARPPNVPSDARLIATSDGPEWEHGVVEDGKKHGAFLAWRVDGTLVNICHYDRDVPHGCFFRFHETGEISQRGRFAHGKIVGCREMLRAQGPSTERSMEGLGDEVMRSEIWYDAHGRVIAAFAFDATGRELEEDGAEAPQAPVAHARFDAKRRVWLEGTLRDLPTGAERDGRWCVFDAEGVPVEEEMWASGVRHGPARSWRRGRDGQTTVVEGTFVDGERAGVWRETSGDGTLRKRTTYRRDERHAEALLQDVEIFEADGRCMERHVLDDEGNTVGPVWRRAEVGSLAIEKAVAKRGAVTPSGLPFGPWTLEDEAGKVVWAGSLGAAPSGPLHENPVLADEPLATERLAQLFAQASVRDDRTAALLAAIRLAGRGQVDLLRGLLRLSQVPFVPEYQVGWAGAVVQQVQRTIGGAPQQALRGFLVSHVGAILMGADPAALACDLAVRFDQALKHHVAIDFASAAIALAPERLPYRFTRALAFMSLGRFSEARRDAAAMAAQHADRATFIERYVDVCEAPFLPWPAPAEIDGEAAAAHPTPTLARTATEVGERLAELVARYTAFRDAVVARGISTLLLPDLSSEAVPAKVAVARERVELSAAIPDLVRDARLAWVAYSCTSAFFGGVTPGHGLAPAPQAGAIVALLHAANAAATAGADGAPPTAPSTFFGLDVGALPSTVLRLYVVPVTQAADAAMRWLTDANVRSSVEEDEGEASFDEEDDDASDEAA